VSTATKSENKTEFVKNFLSSNSQGNIKAVNEAWAAAGMNGTIGATLIYKLRSEMGLSGNLPAKSQSRTAAKSESDTNTSKAASIQGKTSFVREFLQYNPQAKAKAVNEAWAAAGMKGTISHTVISEGRKQLGLIGNQPGKPRTAAKAKSATKMSRPANSPGKTMFVKEFLNDHPQGNVDAVKEAWQAAGFDGTISPTLVNKMRALLGLTGNLRRNTKKSKTSSKGKKPASPRKEAAAASNGQPRGRKTDRTHALLDVEAEIDRLMFQVMRIGDLPEVENALREARRRVYGALSS
jgi:hypothetical protein